MVKYRPQTCRGRKPQPPRHVLYRPAAQSAEGRDIGGYYRSIACDHRKEVEKHRRSCSTRTIPSCSSSRSLCSTQKTLVSDAYRGKMKELRRELQVTLLRMELKQALSIYRYGVGGMVIADGTGHKEYDPEQPFYDLQYLQEYMDHHNRRPNNRHGVLEYDPYRPSYFPRHEG